MPGKQEYLDAANKKPKDRSPYEQGLVSQAHDLRMTDVTNADHAAKEAQKTYG